ncbi:MAG: hypothetical protein JRJ06_09290 [Deltaproteobacteria bacterium]|nr:hypothetical protein [Deltaproteobacteria bacterium]
MTEQQHCPGFEDNKNLKTYLCKCQNCGEEKEIFSDELDKKHICGGCGQEIDVKQCAQEGGA